MGTSGSRPNAPPKSPIVPPWADTDGKGPGPEPEPGRFKQFRTSLGRFAKSGSSSDIRTALGHYARTSLGGDGGTSGARRMQPAIRVGAGLAAALAGVARGETGEAVLGFNLVAMAGAPIQEVIAAIVNALAPAGGLPKRMKFVKHSPKVWRLV